MSINKKNLKHANKSEKDPELVNQSKSTSKLSIKIIEVWLPIIISVIAVVISLVQFKRTVRDSQIEREIRIREGEPLLTISKHGFASDTTNYSFVPKITNIGQRSANDVLTRSLIVYGDENGDNLKFVDSVRFLSQNPIAPDETVDFFSGKFNIKHAQKTYFVIQITYTDLLSTNIAKLTKIKDYKNRFTSEYFFIERHPLPIRGRNYDPKAFALDKKIADKIRTNSIVKKFLE